MRSTKLVFVVLALAMLLAPVAPALASSSPGQAGAQQAGRSHLPAVSISSPWAATPPSIDGSIGFGEWQIANKITLANGLITVLNDSLRLYILIDLLSDTGNDASDYFWLTFDVNENATIDANVDLNYGLTSTNMRYQYYLGPGSWTGVQANTFSSRGRGFGCFFADGSLTFSLFPFRINCSSHRVWELGIDLTEINAAAGQTIRMGVRAASSSPSFTEDTPANFYNNFGDLIEVSLASPPAPLPAASPGATIALDTNPIEVTQAIQTRTNTLPLVQDKSTVARVYVDANGTFIPQPVKTYLYGSVGGVDLPGSPLASLHMAPATIDRAQLSHTANFLLPSSWPKGTVSFSARAVSLLGSLSSSSAISLAFTPKEVPDYWVVPINTGSNAAPVVPSNAEIASQESYLKSIYPVKSVNFTQKGWQVIGPTTVDNTINALNQYFNNVFIAWFITLLFTGQAPFVLPDQIYGLPPSGGGISDPTWFNSGQGWVARGFRGTSLEGTMAHEINHNLDRSTNGTWGRHVPMGCGAGGPDSAWPYANDDIQEVGFDTRLPWSSGGGTLTVIPATTPDIMSYCQSGVLPTKWISPYRWQNLFNNFDTVSPSSVASIIQQIHTVYYLTGKLFSSGGGELDPVLAQPGIPNEEILPGEYALEIQNADGKVLKTIPFSASFVDPEGEPLDTVYFNFHIGEVDGAARFLLKHGDQVLDEIVASAGPPSVDLTSPNGGEQWSGLQTVQWTASDPDGDPLSFNLLYSPDNGQSWFPVASMLQGNSAEIDTSVLPGGDQAKLRIIATDGFHNAEDETDGTFSLEPKPPQAIIQAPSSGSTLPPSVPVLLLGDASDLEDTELPEEAFVWTEGDNVLGTGRQVEAFLAPGAHLITLTVVDSDENTGQATAEVFVGTKLYMPVINRQ